MAISDVAAFTHLTDADVEALGREFDAIRQEIEESRGSSDAAYITRIITMQRQLMVAGRLTLFASSFPPAWVAGTALLAVGKILENMEIGHNVMHGQWDWMNDPEIHSGTWEWDNTCPADQWKHSHNFVHHTFTNVLEKDNDVGYGILRVTSDQKWHVANLGQPVYYALLALLFEWGVALHDLDIVAVRKREKDPRDLRRQLKGIWGKVRRQVAKDYLIFPLLTGPNYLSTLTANVTANYTWILTGTSSAFVVADYEYTGKSYGSFIVSTPAAPNPAYVDPAYSVVNLNVGVNLGPFEVSLFAKNLLNNDTILQSPTINGITEGYTLRPRTVGVALQAKF